MPKSSKFVLSTVGTSLLTRQINRGNQSESDWFKRLTDAANLSEEDSGKDIQQIVLTLKDRASRVLAQNDSVQNRDISAELNGIYGLYDNQLIQGKSDFHLLIATDTYQGKVTAQILTEFLVSQGLTADYLAPKNLNTQNTANFQDGIDHLLSKLDEMLVDSPSEVCFNLVGGFKSLQGYMNTIGMLYAHEIIYIFEGASSELIRIPRLPITIDFKALEPHYRSFAILDSGGEISVSELTQIPECLLCYLDNMWDLSLWGRLIWNKIRQNFLAGDLLSLPNMVYEDSFKGDYAKQKNIKERIRLQEQLLYISGQLEQDSGVSRLRQDSRVQLEVYKKEKNKPQPFEHFKVNHSLRVVCRLVDTGLVLFYYGSHDYTEQKAGVR